MDRSLLVVMLRSISICCAMCCMALPHPVGAASRRLQKPGFCSGRRCSQDSGFFWISPGPELLQPNSSSPRPADIFGSQRRRSPRCCQGTVRRNRNKIRNPAFKSSCGLMRRLRREADSTTSGKVAKPCSLSFGRSCTWPGPTAQTKHFFSLRSPCRLLVPAHRPDPPVTLWSDSARCREPAAKARARPALDSTNSDSAKLQSSMLFGDTGSRPQALCLDAVYCRSLPV